MGENELVEPLAETVTSPVATGYNVYGDDAGVIPTVPETEETSELLSSNQPPAVQVPPPQSPTEQLTPVQSFVEQAPVVTDPVERLAFMSRKCKFMFALCC